MIDDFENHTVGLTSPCSAAEAVAPSDTADLTYASRVLYIGTPGDLRIEMLSGDVVTLVGVPGGSAYPIRAVKVLSTGTTAGSILALR